MTATQPRKIIAAFIGRDDPRWQGCLVCVADDGTWFTCTPGDDHWEAMTPPVFPEGKPDEDVRF